MLQAVKYIIFLSLLLLPACQMMRSEIKAEAGTIDLSSTTLEGSYALDGEWEFYWNTLYTPDDFQQTDRPAPFVVNVPFSWTNYQFKERKLPAYGFGTYRLIIKLPPGQENLGLYVPKIWSAARVWVNGKLIYEAGKVGKEAATYENKIIETLLAITPEQDELELVVQVANFDIFIAGIIQSFRIGQYQPMLEQKELNSSWHLMWIGVLIIMGFYHIILYYFRRKNPSTLFFGIITLLIAIRFIVFGEHYLYEYLKHHVGWLSFAIQSKTYYIATFVLIPLGLNYVVCLYPKEPIKKLFKLSNKKIIQVCSAITAIYCFFLLVTPPSLFTQTLLLYQGVIGVFLLYMAYVLVSAALRRRNESGVQMLGVSTMIFAGINDGLHAQGIELVGQLELMPIAFGIFLSLQFFILARRFSRAFNEVEDLSENLEQKVAVRTKELVDKNEEIEQQKEILRHNSEALQHAYKQITDSVRYAQRIQKAVLGAPQQLQALIKESFVLFLPKDIVSGDFYVFREWQGRKIIIAADATGHGVPGAFMTVLGAELLNEIIEQSPKAAPHEILHQLDEKLSHILTNQGEEKKINDGMDMGILIFDETTQEALYAGAKMSLYYVRNETLTQVEAVKLPIGGAAQYKKQKIFTTQRIDFQPGDFIYLASDGYQDQFGGEEKRKFLKKRFKELLLKVHTLPANEQKEYLETTFRHWKKDHPQTDDVIVVGLQVG